MVSESLGWSRRVQDCSENLGAYRRVKTVLEGPGSRILDSQKLLGSRTSLGWFRKFQDV